MKILFLPYYYYISYEPFKATILEIIKRGVNAKLLHIPNISPRDERGIYNCERFMRDGVPFIEFTLTRFSCRNILCRIPLQGLQFLLNQQKMRNLLRDLDPDGLVIGSHLGGIYVRLAQILCKELGIPIVSLWVTDDKIIEKRDAVKRPPVPRLIKSVLDWQPNNEYTESSRFLVTGSVLRNHLMRQGIRKDQIVITGNPSHDEIWKGMGCRQNPRSMLEFAGGQRYIVLLTEVIQELFGLKYLEALIRCIRKAFDKLPRDIRLAIKFHPRESEDSKAIFRMEFSGERISYFEDVELAYLLSGAELAIGHHTKALETAFIVGTPVLSINLAKNEELSLYKNCDRIMECFTQDEVEDKLVRFFADESFRKKGECARLTWLKYNICAMDGRNSRRAADAITSFVEKFTNVSRI